MYYTMQLVRLQLPTPPLPDKAELPAIVQLMRALEKAPPPAMPGLLAELPVSRQL